MYLDIPSGTAGETVSNAATHQTHQVISDNNVKMSLWVSFEITADFSNDK